MSKVALIGMGVLVLTGCAPEQIRIPVAFDQAQARALLKPGTNQITGRINADLPNQSRVTCANREVSLVPATAYAREWARQFYETDSGRYGTLDAAYRLDSREKDLHFVGAESFYATTRVTRCDQDGEFVFDQVGNGEFFVVAETRWLGRYHDYYDFMYSTNQSQEEDGSVMERVRLTGGDSIDLDWEPDDPVLLDGDGLTR